MIARLVTGFALPRLLFVALTDRVARLAIALPHSALLAIAEFKARDFDLGNRDGHPIFSLTPNHLAVGNVLLEILFDLTLNDGAESGMISFYVVDHRASFLLKFKLKCLRLLAFFHISTGKDAGYEIKHIGRTNFAVTVVLN